MSSENIFANFFTSKPSPSHQNKFYHITTHLNLTRARFISLTGGILTFVSTIILQVYYRFVLTPAISSKEILAVTIPQAVFLIIFFCFYYFPKNITRHQHQRFWLIVFNIFMLLIGIILALVNVDKISAVSAYILVLSFLVIAFYWSKTEVWTIFVIGNTVFISILLYLQEPQPTAISSMINCLIFSLIFVFLSRTFYNLKIREFETRETLQNQTNTLKERNFELDQFVYKTSHDLRAPLTSIMGLINIMRIENPQTQEEVTQYIDMIENRTFKLDDFIQSLLAYSRSNNKEIKYEVIEFEELLNAGVEELKYLENFQRLHIDIQIDALPSFHSDALRLSIIAQNLISNAIKYQDTGKARSFLKIIITVDNKEANILFTDNGVGIHQEYIQDVFKMFYRANEHVEGSGLGLYIVKQSAAKLMGNISVISVIDEGTTFKLSVPNQIYKFNT